MVAGARAPLAGLWIAALAAALACVAAAPLAEATTPALSKSSLDMRNDGTWAASLTLVFNTPVEVHTSEADTLADILVKPARPPGHTTLGSASGAALELSGRTATVFFSPAGEERMRLITESNSSLYISGTALKSADTGTPLSQVGVPGFTTPWDRLSWDNGDFVAPNVASSTLDRDSGVLSIVADESLAYGAYLTHGLYRYPSLQDFGLPAGSNVTKFHVRDGPSATQGITLSDSNAPTAHRAPIHEIRFTLSAPQLSAVSGFADPYLHIDAGAFGGLDADFVITQVVNNKIARPLDYGRVRDVIPAPQLVSASLVPETRVLAATFSEPVSAPIAGLLFGGLPIQPGTVYVGPAGDTDGFTAGTDVRLPVDGELRSQAATITAAELALVLAMNEPTLYAEENSVAASGVPNGADSVPLTVAPSPALESSSLDTRNDGTWAATLTLVFNTPMEIHTSEARTLEGILVKPNAALTHAADAAAGSALRIDGSTVKVFFAPEAENDIRKITESASSLYISGTALRSDAGMPLAQVGSRGFTTPGDQLAWSHTDRAPPKVTSAAIDRDGMVLSVVADESLAYGEYVTETFTSTGGILDLGGFPAGNATKFHVRDGQSATGGITMAASNSPAVHRSPAHEIRFALSEAQLSAIAGYADPYLHVEAGAFSGVGSEFLLRYDSNEDIAKRLNYLPGIRSAEIDVETDRVEVTFDELVRPGSGSFYIRDGDGQYDPETDVRGALSVSGAAGYATLPYLQARSVEDMYGPILHLDGGAVLDSDGAANIAKSANLGGIEPDSVRLESLTVSSDNAARNPFNVSDTEYGVVRPGDTVTVRMEASPAGQPIAGASAVVAGQAVTVSIDSDGFGASASATVQPGTADGPLEFALTASDGSGVSSSFGPSDLTGDNVMHDSTPPEISRAEISGTTSLTIYYTEPVGLSSLGYTATVDGTTINRPSGAAPALSVYGNNTSVVLLSWTGVTATLPTDTAPGSDVSFGSPQYVPDLAGNLAPSYQPRTILLPTGAEIPYSPDLDIECTIHLGDGTVYAELGFDVTCTATTIGIENFNPGSETTAVFPNHPIVVAPASPGLPTVTYPAGVEATLGDSKPATLRLESVAGDLPREIGALVTNAEQISLEHPGLIDAPLSAWLVGSAERDVSFSKPVLLQFPPGSLPGTVVFTISADGTSLRVSECASPVLESDTADDLRAKVSESGGLVDPDACAESDANRVWTLHYSYFATSLAEMSGGSECDDCTPPTLGYDEHGRLLVDGGFSYNGLASDVEHFFTPYPLIEAEVGAQNTAVLKIYENEGPGNLAHASLAFGLRSGQVISESKAVINYDISHDGTGTVSLTDPEGAIDAETLSASHETAECSDGSQLECVSISISHTFRAPLEFDIVGTDVWDRPRNAWQNYFNHGVNVHGEPLDPQPGTAVNGGALILHPISDGSANTDVMADSAGHLYKLSPGGEYMPLANQSRLYHEIDESMYVYDGVPAQGYDRGDPQFAAHLEAQIEAAQLVREQIAPRPAPWAPAYQVVPYERPPGQSLEEAVEAEQLRALLLFEELFGYQDINGQN